PLRERDRAAGAAGRRPRPLGEPGTPLHEDPRDGSHPPDGPPPKDRLSNRKHPRRWRAAQRARLFTRLLAEFPAVGLLLAFVAISLLLAVTPGPDMALVTKNALAHGPRGVLLTTTGIAFALVLWVTATAIGLAAVLKASTTLFYALKLAGGAYLAYLGIRAWLASRKQPGDLLEGVRSAPAGSILRQGFLSAGTNPKLGVLFVTFLPQFVDPRRPLLEQLRWLQRRLGGHVARAVGGDPPVPRAQLDVLAAQHLGLLGDYPPDSVRQLGAGRSHVSPGDDVRLQRLQVDVDAARLRQLP